MSNTYQVTVNHRGVPIETIDVEALTDAHAKMRAHTLRKVHGFHELGDTYDAHVADPVGDEVALAILQAQVNEHFCSDTWQGLGLLIVDDERREAV